MAFLSRTFVVVFITANSSKERQAWTKIISDILGYVTVFSGSGLWQGISEPSIALLSYVESIPSTLDKLVPVLVSYKVDAKQKQIGIIVNGVLVGFDTVDEIQNWRNIIPTDIYE